MNSSQEFQNITNHLINQSTNILTYQNFIQYIHQNQYRINQVQNYFKFNVQFRLAKICVYRIFDDFKEDVATFLASLTYQNPFLIYYEDKFYEFLRKNWDSENQTLIQNLKNYYSQFQRPKLNVQYFLHPQEMFELKNVLKKCCLYQQQQENQLSEIFQADIQRKAENIKKNQKSFFNKVMKMINSPTDESKKQFKQVQKFISFQNEIVLKKFLQDIIVYYERQFQIGQFQVFNQQQVYEKLNSICENLIKKEFLKHQKQFYDEFASNLQKTYFKYYRCQRDEIQQRLKHMNKENNNNIKILKQQKLQFFLLKKRQLEEHISIDLDNNEYIFKENFIYQDIISRVQEKVFKVFLDNSNEPKTYEMLQFYYNQDIGKYFNLPDQDKIVYQTLKQKNPQFLYQLVMSIVQKRYSLCNSRVELFLLNFDYKTEISFLKGLNLIHPINLDQQLELSVDSLFITLQQNQIQNLYFDNINEKIYILCYLFRFYFSSLNAYQNYFILKKGFIQLIDMFYDTQYQYNCKKIFDLIQEVYKTKGYHTDFRQTKQLNQYLNQYQFQSILNFTQLNKSQNVESYEMILSISGFLSEEMDKHKDWKQIDIYNPYIQHISLNWSSNNYSTILNYFDSFKKFKQVFTQKETNPFNQSFSTAIKTAQMLAILLTQYGYFGNRQINIISYSLGTVLNFELLVELQKMNSRVKIGDVVLLGSCLETNRFENEVPKLIGKNGVIQGQIKIVVSEQDQVLRYLFPFAKDSQALGIEIPDFDKIAMQLQQQDSFFWDWEHVQIVEYVKNKIIIYDLSYVIKNHWQYISKLLYILRRVNFQYEDHNNITEERNFLQLILKQQIF